MILEQGLVAFASVISFALLFHVPPSQYLCCGITGAVGWACYLASMEVLQSAIVASLVASLVLAVLSRFFAVRRRMPILIFLISGIFPLVPGAGIYYTAYHFIMNNNAEALRMGTESFKIAVAIALGIVLVLSLPARFFSKRVKKG